MDEDESANLETGEEVRFVSVSVGGVNSAFSVFIFILRIII